MGYLEHRNSSITVLSPACRKAILIFLGKYMPHRTPNQEHFAAQENAKHGLNGLVDEQVLRKMLDLAPVSLFIIDHEGRIVLMNRGAEQTFGYTRDYMIGRGVELLLPARYQEQYNRQRQAVMDSLPTLPMGLRVELYAQSKDGREFPAEVKLSPLTNGLVKIYSAVIHDITGRKAEENKLHDLTARLLSIREEERLQVSRAIHDELGQALTGLKMDVAWLQRHLTREQADALAKTEAMVKLIDDTIQSVRHISAQIRPAILDDIGLTAAVEWQLKEFESRTGIQCVYSRGPEEMALDGDIATTAFRIFQEALTNVARHASATRIVTSVQVIGDTLMMCVQDNGRGITDGEISSPKSLGLMGMLERAHLMHGEVQVRGMPGQGTTVVLQLPLRSTAD
ncbi:MAG TPA: PAS domain S-box protein [Anaerolineae bacterium]